MNIKTEKLPKSRIKFHIIADKQDIAHFFDMALEHLKKDLKIQGFRPGKVPDNIAKDALGEHSLEHEAQDIAINDTYLQLVTKEKLVPVARPENIKINNFSEADGFDWEGEIDVLPEIKLDSWKEKIKKHSSKIKKGEVKLETKEIEETLAGLQKQFAELEVKESENGSAPLTAKGDWASIDIDIADKGKFDEEMLKKFKANGFTLVIGEANFIPGFEENLLGLEKGSEKEFDATFPENYSEKTLQGQTVRFKIKINDIKTVILPEVNDKFSNNFGFEKVDDLKKAIEDDILNKKHSDEKAKYEDDILKALVIDNEIDLPDALIEQEKDMITNRFVHDLEHHKGIKFADYLMSLGKNEKEFRDGFTQHATTNVKIGLLIGQIAKNEKIEVSDSDTEEMMAIDVVNQTTGLPPEKVIEMEEKIKERYSDDEFVSSIKNSIMARKTVDLIIEQLNNK
jgi:trigger factor